MGIKSMNVCDKCARTISEFKCSICDCDLCSNCTKPLSLSFNIFTVNSIDYRGNAASRNLLTGWLCPDCKSKIDSSPEVQQIIQENYKDILQVPKLLFLLKKICLVESLDTQNIERRQNEK